MAHLNEVIALQASTKKNLDDLKSHQSRLIRNIADYDQSIKTLISEKNSLSRAISRESRALSRLSRQRVDVERDLSLIADAIKRSEDTIYQLQIEESDWQRDFTQARNLFDQ